MLVFLFVLLILAVILQIISLRDGLDHIRFDFRPSAKEIEPGTRFYLDLAFSNTWYLPVSFLQGDIFVPKALDFPEEAIVEEGNFTNTLTYSTSLGMKKKVTARIPVSAEKRGIHHFTGANLQRGDFFGLYEVGRRWDTTGSILVYPAPMQNHTLLETLGNIYGEMVAKQFLIKDPILTTCCREYTGQEPMHTISWNQTARHGQLMVREFDPTRELSCVILLAHEGLSKENEHLLDLCCSIARSSGDYLMDRGVAIEFFTNSAMSGFARNAVRHISSNKDTARDYWAGLATLLTHGAGSLNMLADTAIRQSNDASSFILIAPTRTPKIDSLAAKLSQVAGSSFHLILAESFMEREVENVG